MKDTQLTIQENATRSAWTVPYTAVEAPAAGAPRPTPEPPPPPAPRAGRNDFRCGEKVAFEDKHLNTVVRIVSVRRLHLDGVATHDQDAGRRAARRPTATE